MNNIIDYKSYLIDRIEILKQEIDLIWENFMINEISNGMKLISEMFGDLDKIITEINEIKNIDISDFLNNMEKLENAMKVSDYMLIADLVKYEIKPIVSKWKNELDSKFEIYSN